MEAQPTKRSAKPPADPERRIIGGILGAVLVVLLLVVGFGILFAAGELSAREAAKFVGGAVVVWLAAFMLGAFGGFLFGLPRRSGDQARSAGADGTASPPQQAGRPTGFLASDNLTRVAEWLTTILVGIGLVQATQVASWVGGIADDVANALLPTADQGRAFAAALLIAGFVPGVLAGYLLTALVLAGRIVNAALAFEQRIREEERVRFEYRDAVRAEWRSRPIESLLPGPDGTWPAQPQLSEAEAFVAALGVDEVGDDPDLLRAWAKLQLAGRRLDRAEEGFRRAIALRADRPELRNELALTLLAAQRQRERGPEEERANTLPSSAPADIFAAAESALRLAEAPGQGAVTTPATRLRALKNTALAALYLPPPDGFTRAKEAIAKAEAELPELAANDADFQLWKACALGQEHRYLSERGGNAEILAELVKQAEEAVRRAWSLRPDPSWRAWIRQLADRRFREMKGGPANENDLETIFAASSELQALLQQG